MDTASLLLMAQQTVQPVMNEKGSSYVWAVVFTGLSVVFLGLIILILFVWLMGKVFTIGKGKKKEAPKQAAPVQAAPVEAAPAPAPAPAPQPQAIPVQPVQPVQPVYAQPTPVAPMGGMPMGPSDPGLAKNILVMGIVAVATACTVWFGFLGIIFGILGLNKAKKFTEECGQLYGKAKVGKFLSLGGLIGGACVTAYVAFYIFMAIITVIAEYN